MGEYADLETERQQRAFADECQRDHEAEQQRIAEIKRSRSGLQAIGMSLVQKTVHHFHVVYRGRVVAQWWPARGKTMIGTEKGPRCQGAKELVAMARARILSRG